MLGGPASLVVPATPQRGLAALQAVQLGGTAVPEPPLPERAASQGPHEDGPQGRPDGKPIQWDRMAGAKLGQALSLNQPRPLVGKLPCSLMTFPSCLTALFPWGFL